MRSPANRPSSSRMEKTDEPGLADRLPWLHQWHHAIDPEFHEPLATIYQAYYHQQRHALRLTDEQIEAVRMGK